MLGLSAAASLNYLKVSLDLELLDRCAVRGHRCSGAAFLGCMAQVFAARAV